MSNACLLTISPLPNCSEALCFVHLKKTGLLQASIILRRKASKAEELQEAREELATAERELRERSNQAQASEGREVVRGDEVHHLIFFFHSLGKRASEISSGIFSKKPGRFDQPRRTIAKKKNNILHNSLLLVSFNMATKLQLYLSE